ncbi:hypothetical protein BD289DRAFT_375946 [Coniella lustricola]|uniref:Formylmethionine deformylase-like protein n=1 Tax=Coniella lustricola TaxID=2025994 RepID=A0A2T2ZXL0_9PEZI|nr:hypothetical protein BD289DRAFT_375946 [Coniella lustricola]
MRGLIDSEPNDNLCSGSPTDTKNATRARDHLAPDLLHTTPWRIHWKAPLFILGYLLVGIGFALGHHFYWRSLDGSLVDTQRDQEWAQRYGIAFAFLAQSALTLSVGVAYTQRVWLTVKQNAFKLGTLDRLFSLQNDLFGFFSFEILGKAKVLCFLALCAWCLPIASTFSSATLSIKTGIVQHTTPVSVPVPDYTSSSEAYWATFEGVGRLDGVTPAVTRLVAATSTAMYVLPFDARFPNSSYTIQFYGPAARCENLEIATSNSTLYTGAATSLQEAWDLTMTGLLNSTMQISYAAASTEQLASVEMPSHFFVNIGGARDLASEQSSSNYSCHYWNTSYTVDFTFDNGVQSANIQKLQYVAPLNISSGNLLYEYAPGQIQYWTMFTALMDILATQIGFGSTGSFFGSDSGVVKSGIAACPEIRYGFNDTDPYFAPLFDDWMCRAGSVPRAIEDLSRNITLSILSSTLLSNQTIADVSSFHSANFYTYNWKNLVMAYAVAIVVATICAIVGLHALLANGYSAGANFSSIMLSTRNSDLDRIARGHCLGKTPLADDIKTIILRYGILEATSNEYQYEPHAAFGFKSKVRTLEKGEECW